MEEDAICRLCAQNIVGKSFNVYSKSRIGPQIVQLINQFIPIVIYRTDPLSKDVCGTCLDVLETFASFERRCLETQDTFQSNLMNNSNDDNVKLYLDVMTHEDKGRLNGLKSLSPVKNTSCQTSLLESLLYKPCQAKFNNDTDRLMPSLTVLTPKKINQLTFGEDDDSDGQAYMQLRRRAGPRSKTRNIKTYNPSTLLQCTLKKINQLLRLEPEPCARSLRVRPNRKRNDDDNTHFEVDLNEPAVCNYCMKHCENIVELSQHEMQHMYVDIGPKVEDPVYETRYKNYAKMYADSLVRETDTKPEVQLTKKTRMNTMNRRTILERLTDSDAEDSLLVADHIESGLNIRNNVVYINDTPIQEVPKEVRRSQYRTIVINGVKRKYCPLCRHTFKDNWSIEHHLMKNICPFTCRFCGMKFRSQPEMFAEHMTVHEGEVTTKIFGPSWSRKGKRKKITTVCRQRSRPSRVVKPLKLKQLLQKKNQTEPRISTPPIPKLKIKLEPGTEEPITATPPQVTRRRPNPVEDSVTLELNNKCTPHQAYFCRKCYQVFYRIEEYDLHVDVCTGEAPPETKQLPIQIKSVEGARPRHNGSPAPTTSTSKRPLRSCVRELNIPEYESEPDESGSTLSNPPKKLKKSPLAKGSLNFACGICLSSFPSPQSRNSHMRVHKGMVPPQRPVQQQRQRPQQPVQRRPVPMPVGARPSPQSHPTAYKNLLANLNPTVARLVQNNPHLTIRSYSASEEPPKSQATPPPPPKSQPTPPQSQPTPPPTEEQKYFRCSDCLEKFANKSVLYFHKLHDCVVKRTFQCAFCRKRFSSKEHYNLHMLYVHPE